MIRTQSLAISTKRFLGLFFKQPERASLGKIRGKVVLEEVPSVALEVSSALNSCPSSAGKLVPTSSLRYLPSSGLCFFLKCPGNN